MLPSLMIFRQQFCCEIYHSLTCFMYILEPELFKHFQKETKKSCFMKGYVSKICILFEKGFLCMNEWSLSLFEYVKSKNNVEPVWNENNFF